jgi:hypothetical protein
MCTHISQTLALIHTLRSVPAEVLRAVASGRGAAVSAVGGDEGHGGAA